MRGTRPHPSSSLTTFAQPSLFQPANITTRPHPTQSSLSFKQHRSVVDPSSAADGPMDSCQSQDIPAVHLPVPFTDPLLPPEDMPTDGNGGERLPSPIDDPFITTTPANTPTNKAKSKIKSKSKTNRPPYSPSPNNNAQTYESSLTYDSFWSSHSTATYRNGAEIESGV